MSLYFLPSIFSLFIKVMIFWFGRFSIGSIYVWLLFVGFFGVNSFELLSFYLADAPENAYWGLVGYYFFAFMSLWFLAVLALDNARLLTWQLKLVLSAICFVIAIVLLVPGLGLSGVKSIGYSITRVAGPYYFVIQLGILLPLVSAFIVLFYSSFNGQTQLIKRKAKILLIACLPIFFATIIVMLLMQLGYAINASVILSLMISITMLILLVSERKNYDFQFIDRAHLFRLSSLIPRSSDGRFIKSMVNLVNNPGVGLEKGKALIEQEMIQEALVLSDGSKTKAAEMLGVSRQTLVRRLSKNS